MTRIIRLAVVLALMTLNTGCDAFEQGFKQGFSNPQGLPCPNDAGFINWLTGQRITLEKGVFADYVWTIATGEVSDFQVVRITGSPSDHAYTATVSFRATAHGSGIDVKEALIRYRDAPDHPGRLEFVEFVPVSVSRIGN